ncbi:kinesin-like protein Klp61F [Manduca sexta]|uniref:kinesin-like protein Klp61F n=1 Tax=Manduca sexta TaxID=7130 RepID=UPI0018902AC1|nr:kinesin-like protein Klp61F [Manduca sexta]
MTSEKGCRKDKNQNIQVFVRLRPLNQRERDLKSLGVVEVHHNKEVVVRFTQQTNLTKKFTFDRAFAPNASQVEIYQEVVSPLIEEVLAGYNCTVFAYGQTGTGKTHTMVGENTGDETTWQKDPLAGIIPRALSQLFDELRISNTEYTVRVSYLELYNEELFDLLSTSEDNSKLRIYEDVTRKGSNIVNGLEEITVYNKKEVYKIMAQGQERKRVASTLMNAQSSNHPNGKENRVRSHTVFTIVVHMKENSPEGEELVKIGKLNLVDLAGSENISKAGSDNPAKRERARECVNINQSLLTLGRVITALVERHPHVPYRESKLTRILQESLGGRTKTSIIATISPGHKDLEETMSTLEYAHRAKNIQNKPEVNQKMTKKAILKEYAEEIDRLKRDLQAARDKNGVYLASDTFAEMTLKQEEQKKEIQELLLKKRAMEEERDRMEGVFADLNQKLEIRDTELNVTKNNLNTTKAKLANTNNLLRATRLQCEEQRELVQHHQKTEVNLGAQARDLLSVADTATTHVTHLHDSLDKRRSLESNNLETTKLYQEESAQHREQIAENVETCVQAIASALENMDAVLDEYTTSSTQTHDENRQKLETLAKTIMETMDEIKSLSTSSQSRLVEDTSSHRSRLQAAVSSHQRAVCDALTGLMRSVDSCVQRAEDTDVKGNVAKFVQQWWSGAEARVQSLRRLHAAHGRRRHARRARLDSRRTAALHCIQQIETEKSEIESRLSRQLVEDIETERRATEQRLQDWMEEERRLLEERLQRHVAAEKNALEERLKKKVDEVEEERKLLEERMARHVQWQQDQLAANTQEMEIADKDLEEFEQYSEECDASFNKYGKQFEEGASAISTDMEIFSRNVVEVVEHINNELLNALRQAREQNKKELNDVMETDAENSKRLTDDVDAVLTDVVKSTEQILETAVGKIEMNNTSTIERLSEVSSSTSEEVARWSLTRERQRGAAGDTRGAARQLRERLHGALQRLADLQRQYLASRYARYEPSGKTPSRMDYRYPRTLVATSPHDRILKRFRAMRQNSQDDDVILVESESNSRAASDSESSTADESAFTSPSPPDAKEHAPIVKCTSETDIYAIKKQQDMRGKENLDRTMSYKKPSKLPAPASHKKPLVERNGTIN